MNDIRTVEPAGPKPLTQPLDVLRRRTDVRFRVVEDEGVVVRQAAGEVLVLNEVATRILALADGATPVAGWVDCLALEFEIDRPALQRDGLAFAAELIPQGLLERFAAAVPASPANT